MGIDSLSRGAGAHGAALSGLAVRSALAADDPRTRFRQALLAAIGNWRTVGSTAGLIALCWPPPGLGEWIVGESLRGTLFQQAAAAPAKRASIPRLIFQAAGLMPASSWIWAWSLAVACPRKLVHGLRSCGSGPRRPMPRRRFGMAGGAAHLSDGLPVGAVRAVRRPGGRSLCPHVQGRGLVGRIVEPEILMDGDHESHHAPCRNGYAHGSYESPSVNGVFWREHPAKPR